MQDTRALRTIVDQMAATRPDGRTAPLDAQTVQHMIERAMHDVLQAIKRGDATTNPTTMSTPPTMRTQSSTAAQPAKQTKADSPHLTREDIRDIVANYMPNSSTIPRDQPRGPRDPDHDGHVRDTKSPPLTRDDVYTMISRLTTQDQRSEAGDRRARFSRRDLDEAEDIINATDVDDDESCEDSLLRTQRLEGTVPHTERYTTVIRVVELTRDAFIQAWTRQLSKLDRASQTGEVVAKELLARLGSAFDMVKSSLAIMDHGNLPGAARQAYQAVQMLRSTQREIVRSQLRIVEKAPYYVINAVDEIYREMLGKEKKRFNPMTIRFDDISAKAMKATQPKSFVNTERGKSRGGRGRGRGGGSTSQHDGTTDGRSSTSTTTAGTSARGRS